MKKIREIFSPALISNYDENISVELSCPSCELRSEITLPWESIESGVGSSKRIRSIPYSKLPVSRHLRVSCPSCGAEITAYLAGYGGGRHGENQYEILAIQFEEEAIIERPRI